jgi:hypothetical protein
MTMRLVTRGISRGIALLLVCALIAVSAPVAQAKPLTLETVHARILKRGLGNWVGIELSNGTCFAGRVVNVDDTSFGLQLHNDPQITPVLYSDVVRLNTGISHGAFWGIMIAGFGASVAAALVMHHEFVENEPKLPSQPTQPVFPY